MSLEAIRTPTSDPTAGGSHASLGRKAKWALGRRLLSPSHLYLGDERVLDLRRLRAHPVSIGLLVIGAAKAGTTSLHHYLHQHPAIFMTQPVKEPGFFLSETRMLEWCASRGVPVRSRADLLPLWMLRGYRGEPLVGESTTAYSDALPGRPFDVPGRARAHNPDMRLVYVVREPVARIVSNVAQSTRSGKPGGDFEAWLDLRFDAMVARSSYWFQLEKWLDAFPAEAVSVVITEEMAQDPAASLAAIHRHLGVAVQQSGEVDFALRNETAATGAPPAITAERVRRMIEERGLGERLRADTLALERHLGRKIDVWAR